MHHLYLTLYHYELFVDIWLALDAAILRQWEPLLNECFFTRRAHSTPTFSVQCDYPEVHTSLPTIVNLILRHATQYKDSLAMELSLCYPNEVAMVVIPVDLTKPLFAS